MKTGRWTDLLMAGPLGPQTQCGVGLAWSPHWWGLLSGSSRGQIGLQSLLPQQGAQILLEMCSRRPEVFLHSIYLTFK